MNDRMANRTFWPAQVPAFEDEHVVVQTTDGQSIRWPRALLPKTLTVGARLFLTAWREQDLARDVLNELLEGS